MTSPEKRGNSMQDASIRELSCSNGFVRIFYVVLHRDRLKGEKRQQFLQWHESDPNRPQPPDFKHVINHVFVPCLLDGPP